MKTFTCRHEISCTPAEFWEKIHLGGFNRAMYDRLGYGYDIIEDNLETGVRKTHITPVVDAPAVLVKALGESVSFEEHGQLHFGANGDGAANRYEFTVLPGVFPKKIKISGKMTTDPSTEGKCFRVVEFNIGCTIFGIGGIFERFVSKEIQKNYDDSAGFTNDYLAGKLNS
ncbi:MAG: DUF2505 family protein [Myxococcota bacterium]